MDACRSQLLAKYMLGKRMHCVYAAQVANLQFRRLFPGWVERQQEGKQQQQEGQAQVGVT